MKEGKKGTSDNKAYSVKLQNALLTATTYNITVNSLFQLAVITERQGNNNNRLKDVKVVKNDTSLIKMINIFCFISV